MTAAAASPLEAFPPWPGLPPLLAKREDLLPHGGGAKVRRFLAHLAAAPADRRTLAVLSERGAHTFLTLARLARDGVTSRPLLFLERGAARTPYAERNRAEVLATPGVTVRNGPLPWLLLRSAWLARRRDEVEVLGVGGQTPGGVAAAAEAGAEARAQLLARGPWAGTTWHLVPAASGTLAAGLLGSLAPEDRLLVVPTGPAAARWRLVRRLRDEPRVRLLSGAAPDPVDVLAAARRLRAHAGIGLDPRHAARAWWALGTLPAPLPPGDRVVLWVTGPRLADDASEGA